MLGNAAEHIAQVGLGIQALEFGRLHQAVDLGRALAASVRVHEQLVAPSQGHPTQRPLGSVVVRLDTAVISIARQGLPASEAIADGLCQFRVGRHVSQQLAQPGVHHLHQRARPTRRTTGGCPRMSRSIAYSIGDAPQGQRRDGGLVAAAAEVQIPPRSARVRPASGLSDLS